VPLSAVQDVDKGSKRAVVVRLFSVVDSRVFSGRTLAIAAELEDAGGGMHRPCKPLLWHLVRSNEAEPTGVFDADTIEVLQPYVKKYKDDELVVALVKMNGSSIDFDAANASAASTSRAQSPRQTPVTRGSHPPLSEDQVNEAVEASQREVESTMARLLASEAANAVLQESNKKLERKALKRRTADSKPTIITSKMSQGELDMVTKAAKKGAMEGASVVAALKVPPTKAAGGSAPRQDTSLMLEMFDKFRNDSKETVDKFRDDNKFAINKMLDLSKILLKEPRSKRKRCNLIAIIAKRAVLARVLLGVMRETRERRGRRRRW
jgi:hypothetical protein